MKLVTRIAVAALVASPLVASAQEGLTRAQVREQLKQLEQAGYNPSERDAFYPNNIQAAEEKIRSGNAYGASPDGTSASGRSMSTTPPGQTPQ